MARLMRPDYSQYIQDFRTRSDEVLRKKAAANQELYGTFDERREADREMKGTYAQHLAENEANFLRGAELQKQIHGTFGERSLLDQWKANLMADTENRKTAVQEGILANQTAESKLNLQLGKDLAGLNKLINEQRVRDIQLKNVLSSADTASKMSDASAEAAVAKRNLLSDFSSRGVLPNPSGIRVLDPTSPYFMSPGKWWGDVSNRLNMGSPETLQKSDALLQRYIDKKNKENLLRQISEASGR